MRRDEETFDSNYDCDNLLGWARITKMKNAFPYRITKNVQDCPHKESRILDSPSTQRDSGPINLQHSNYIASNIRRSILRSENWCIITHGEMKTGGEPRESPTQVSRTGCADGRYCYVQDMW